MEEDGGAVDGGGFVEPGGDAAPLFELVDAALDDVAAAVESTGTDQSINPAACIP
ncbi:hypothetical protein [Amycolatopsis thermophila]|uniref:Uncharacterized protein n=1 Tax=Amycolatopsis thermophila TaxID=206084 RepID=A0ABU0EUD1_9PSEU|nr:hypothetical protein [Amycolatopsis thermophila]MDQ0378918.1 hypothetical protein [Amycolatopsis thermophila]